MTCYYDLFNLSFFLIKTKSYNFAFLFVMNNIQANELCNDPDNEAK